jgi:TRAP-type mannitol/chloroaromatic compound transport system, small permease component
METSVFSPAGVPIFHFKTMLVVGAVLMLIQGVAQVCRCLVCIRTGEWPADVRDVTELEDQLLESGGKDYIASPLEDLPKTGGNER